MSEPTRIVSFLVVRSGTDPTQLRSALGAAVVAGSIGIDEPHAQTWWEIEANGSGATDLSELIEAVMTTVRNWTSNILQASALPDTTCLLRIVHYIGDDDVGPGFALSEATVTLLAQLGAFVDVDQYSV